jgi:hypothetical protein
VSRRSYMRERDRYWLTILELTFVVEADATGSRLAQPYARPWRVTTRRCTTVAQFSDNQHLGGQRNYGDNGYRSCP